ncbi:MAG: response regulator transcription factor [Pseudomonadota bacterium]
MNIRALLVEDNLALAETVVAYLALEQIDCDFAANGVQGKELAGNAAYDVVLLDINLPKMDGLAVCEALRAQGIDSPVLMLTARDTLEDKLAGFQAGTDDYLVKPFEMRELVVRVKALAKRRSGQSQQLVVGPLIMEVARKTLTRDGEAISLSPTSWKILSLLMRESPNVVSREKISYAIWGDDDQPDSDVLKVHLHRLRQKIDKPFADKLLHTVANHGFALRPPDD